MKAMAYILTVSLFGLTQCNLFDWNDDDQQPVVNQLDLLPPLTHEGKFTFGCLVNDTAWVPRTTTRMTSFYQQGTLYIAAEFKGKGKEQNMQLVVNDTALSTNVAYDLATFPKHFAEFFWYYIDKNICTYTPENVLSGTLTLTHFDKVNYIVSGVFEFTTARKGCDTIRVTDGRFDMHYVP